MKDIKVINANIGKIKVAGQKLDQLIQDTAIEVLEHFTVHKDTGLVNRLYLAMPKGSRGIALADWLIKFVAVKVNTNKETKGEQPFVFNKERVEAMTEENLVNAAAVNWYDLKREKALDEVFDIATMVKAMFRRIETSTKVEHFDRPALVALAKVCGIAESDVPTKPSLKAKTVAPVETEKSE